MAGPSTSETATSSTSGKQLDLSGMSSLKDMVQMLQDDLSSKKRVFDAAMAEHFEWLAEIVPETRKRLKMDPTRASVYDFGLPETPSMLRHRRNAAKSKNTTTESSDEENVENAGRRSRRGSMSSVSSSSSLGVKRKALGLLHDEASVKRTRHRDSEDSSVNRALFDAAEPEAEAEGGNDVPAAGDAAQAADSMQQEDDAEDECHVCSKGGELLCCDTCPKVYHIDCVGLDAVPEGDWLCPSCTPAPSSDVQAPADEPTAEPEQEEQEQEDEPPVEAFSTPTKDEPSTPPAAERRRSSNVIANASLATDTRQLLLSPSKPAPRRTRAAARRMEVSTFMPFASPPDSRRHKNKAKGKAKAKPVAKKQEQEQEEEEEVAEMETAASHEPEVAADVEETVQTAEQDKSTVDDAHDDDARDVAQSQLPGESDEAEVALTAPVSVAESSTAAAVRSQQERMAEIRRRVEENKRREAQRREAERRQREATRAEELRRVAELRSKAAEQERIAAEKAEQERIAAEKAEQERIAAEKAEQERIAAEQAEQERIAAEKAEQERIAGEKAEQERIAAEKAEQERIAAEQAEQERIAAEKAEQERIAAEKAEQERIAAEKAEQERIAAEKAEQERIAAELAEQERIAAEKAEQERIAAEKAEQERIAAEKAEQERIAAEKAEQERIAAEKAEQERIAAEKAEQERIAAEKAEQERIAAEEAEQERIAAEKAEQERIAASQQRPESVRAASTDQGSGVGLASVLGKPAAPPAPTAPTVAHDLQFSDDDVEYEISDYSSSSDDDDDDNERHPEKPRPRWAQSDNVCEILKRQAARKLDPDTVFPRGATRVNLEEIFPGSVRSYRNRGESGNWSTDRLTWQEELRYRQQMGFESRNTTTAPPRR